MIRRHLGFLLAVLTSGAYSAPFINEFHAENVGPILTSSGATTGINDVNGSGADWIELRNPDGVAANLNGWALSDDPSNPGKWVFPNVNINAGSYLLVFASGKNRAVASVQLHTNFKLGNSGTVLLSQPDGGGGWTVVHQIGTEAEPYPGQKPRFSYGYPALTGPGGTPGYMEIHTPGALNNSTTYSTFVADTSASVNRGFYSAPQAVTISSTTPGATLIYTTNGSEPNTSVGGGTQVLPPNGATPPSAVVNVTTTTVLRVRAVKVGMAPTNVDTHSYIFPSSVLQQSAATVPLPYAGWGHDKGDANTSQSDQADTDWEMDPRVVNHLNPEDKCVANDLLEIPTVSIVMNWAELFGAGGIYISGEGIDKQASFEILNPDGDPVNPNVGSNKQQPGKMHIFGGSSTARWKSDKLSMSFSFWTDLSTGVLGDTSSGSYDVLVLDARLNQVWNHSQDATQRNRGDFVRDAIMSDLQNAMGSYAPHSQHVHVYLNGLYWGLYTLHEKPEEHFAADYLGGDSDDYDVVKHNPSHAGFLVNGQVINPTLPVSNTNHTAGVNYTALHTLAAADLTVQANYDALAAKLDIDDFINYMLVNFYGGNDDWAHQNWYASYNRVRPDGRWRFHSWDAEHVFKTNNYDATTKNDANGPTALHQRLSTNAEYRVKFGDAAHQHLFNTGLFTPAKGKAAFDARLMDINEAIRAESARWGDSGPSTSTTPSPELHLRFSDVAGGYLSWWTERTRIMTTILDGGTNRTTSLISQLRTRTLYPTIAAPVFNGQHGGNVPANYSLTMTNPGGVGTIYYTLDGSDPRVPLTGAISPAALTNTPPTPVSLAVSCTVKARVRNGTNWSALNEAYFSVGTTPAAAGNLVISKIHYRPSSPTPDEINAGFEDRSDFEFIEVMNIGNNNVDLSGISFSAGLDVSLLPDGVRELAPGGRALFVAKIEAFEFRYGSSLPVAGEFMLGSNLHNDGETLTLRAANLSPIVSVTYTDDPPWPMDPDGLGPSLVLMSPATNDPNLGFNWRESTSSNGSPGIDDRLLFSHWQDQYFSSGDPNAAPMEDPDGDGIVNLIEMGVGSDPLVTTSSSVLPTVQYQTLDVGSGPQKFLTFTFRHVKAAEELVWTAQIAASPTTEWSSNVADLVPVGLPVDHGDGTGSRTFRTAQPVNGAVARMFRAKVVKP